MVAPSPSVQPALRAMVPAGMTAGAAIRGRKAPTYEPDALGVAGDKQGALYDLNWAPESDIEVA